ncbi:MAG TPA: TIGR03943 family protein [Actinomycetota bacterium]|nr:TIGR03943 family protein [Actinomycetota bacterium]
MSRRSLSPKKLGVVLVLGAWCGLYLFLLATDRTSLYLSSRTEWLVPVGGVILLIAVVGQLFFSDSSGAPKLTTKDSLGLVLVAVPVVVVLALPPASLTSFAANRRSSFASAAFVPSIEDISSGELDLADVAGAIRSDEVMAALRARAGAEVDFTGFVARRPGMPADEFLLTRFLISCCVADALTVQVRVVDAPPGAFKQDQWVRVSGSLYPLENEIVVQAAGVTKVPRPDHPYLNA